MHSTKVLGLQHPRGPCFMFAVLILLRQACFFFDMKVGGCEPNTHPNKRGVLPELGVVPAAANFLLETLSLKLSSIFW